MVVLNDPIMKTLCLQLVSTIMTIFNVGIKRYVKRCVRYEIILSKKIKAVESFRLFL